MAQSAGATDQQILAELKGVRAALEKLDSGQKALMTLVRIQINESRVAHLEAQRVQVSAKEQDYRKEADNAAATLRRLENGSGAASVQSETGAIESGASLDLTPFRTRHAQAAQRAEETTRTRQNMDQAIAALRSRIAALEKSLEAAAR
jgi:hypothetical protein